MNSNQNDNQFGQGSKIDSRKNSDTEINMNTASGNAEANDDDFLSGDNESRPYPNNQNNPNEGYNKQMSPGGRSNPNIGGNENEYEDSLEEEDRYNHGNSESEDEIVNRRDNEEIDRHDDEVRYSSPSRNGSHRNH